MKCALTIAGSDPTGGAGLEADLRVFQSLGIHGCAVATSLTTQDSHGVHGVKVLPAAEVGGRLDVLLRDAGMDVIKCGMLGNADMVRQVDAVLNVHQGETPLVLDPVLVSSSGTPLITDEALDVLRADLLPRCRVITPNRREAARLLEVPENLAAEKLALMLSRWVSWAVVTGGEEDEPCVRTHVGREGLVEVIESPRVPGPSPHGTGCTFSSALAAFLIHTRDVRRALNGALAYTHRAVQEAQPLGTQGGMLMCRLPDCLSSFE